MIGWIGPDYWKKISIQLRMTSTKHAYFNKYGHEGYCAVIYEVRCSCYKILRIEKATSGVNIGVLTANANQIGKAALEMLPKPHMKQCSSERGCTCYLRTQRAVSSDLDLQYFKLKRWAWVLPLQNIFRCCFSWFSLILVSCLPLPLAIDSVLFLPHHSLIEYAINILLFSIYLIFCIFDPLFYFLFFHIMRGTASQES